MKILSILLLNLIMTSSFAGYNLEVDEVNDFFCKEYIDDLEETHSNFMSYARGVARKAFERNYAALANIRDKFLYDTQYSSLTREVRLAKAQVSRKGKKQRKSEAYEAVREVIGVPSDDDEYKTSAVLKRNMTLIMCTSAIEGTVKIRSCSSLNLVTGDMGGDSWNNAIARDRHGRAFVEGIVDGRIVGRYQVQPTEEYVLTMLKQERPACLEALYLRDGHNFNYNEIEDGQRHSTLDKADKSQESERARQVESDQA